MTITSSDLVNAFIPQLFYLQWIWLKWIAFTVLWHLRDDFTGVAELTHFAGAPGVEVALFRIVHLILFLEKLVLFTKQGLVQDLHNLLICANCLTWALHAIVQT